MSKKSPTVSQIGSLLLKGLEVMGSRYRLSSVGTCGICVDFYIVVYFPSLIEEYKVF